jgi:hypothetical protein
VSAVKTWSELIRPPRLQRSETDAGKQRTATWLELFFDLAFILVVGELAVGLRDDLTLHGVLVFAGLFTSVWWAWAGFTFYANRFDTDDVVYRLAKLAAMLAITAIQGGIAGSLRSSLPWPGIGVPLVLAVGLASGVRPVVVLAAVTVVLVGEVVGGLAKQRRGTLTTPAPENGP